MTPDIDLIPADYRARQSRVRHAKYVGLATLLLCVGMAAMAAGLGRSALRVEQDNMRHLTESSLTGQQRDQLASLEQRTLELTRQLNTLQGLRSGAAAEDLFVLIDRALPAGQVWFDEWRLVRAGVLATGGNVSEERGYFIVVPADNLRDSDARTVRTTMSIKGQATDHAALSLFVRELYRHPSILEVKLNRSTRQEYKNASVVDFDLSITLQSEAVS